MIRKLFTALAITSLIACSAKAPVAHLSYIGVTAVGSNFKLKFSADVPILELFSKNKHQRIVFRELICSLDTDHNFDIEHKLKYFIHGGIDFVEQSAISGKPVYIFNSNVSFEESPENELDSDVWIPDPKLAKLLEAKTDVTCQVRMTVNFSEPYYSEIFLVPAKDIADVALKDGPKK